MYDIERCHGHLHKRGIADRIARKGVDSKERPGQPRWVVERTYAWLAGMGKLRIRFERSLDTHRALLSLACNIICLRSLDNKKPALSRWPLCCQRRCTDKSHQYSANT